jgi:hypothetical protein
MVPDAAAIGQQLCVPLSSVLKSYADEEESE